MLQSSQASTSLSRGRAIQLVLAGLIALYLGADAHAQKETRGAKTIDAKSVAQRVDEYLERCTPFGFSGSVLVAVGDEVALAKGYGIADAKTGAPCAAETTFDLGSLSKPITALVVLELAERGTLKLDDRLERFFPGTPKDKQGITLHQLLAHTSGLPRGHATVGSRMFERDEFLKCVLALELESKPGAKHSYSNLGYGLVAAAVEVATKKPFEESVRELVFEPAGMERTGFRRDGRVDATTAARGRPLDFDEPRPGSFLARDAAALDSAFEGKFDEKLLATDGWWTWGLRGAGGVLSNVNDLWRLERALRGDALLDAASRATMFKPVLANYACGWNVTKSPRGTPWIEHGGSTGNGFVVKFTRYPEEKVCIVSLSNSASSALPWVNLNVGKLVFGGETALPPAAATLSETDAAAWNAEFHGGKKERLALRVDGSSLWIEALEPRAFWFLSGEIPSLGSARAVAASAKLAEAMMRGDTSAVHAVEDKQQPLNYFDGWWKRLVAHYGKLERASVFGAADDATASGATVVIVVLQFARGTELLQMSWSDEKLRGLRIGGPYPTRRRLVLTGPGSACSFDLVRSTIDASATLKDRKLELAFGKRQLKLERAK
jgi:CubicO group peptidase (beta-lactamase class C family)